MAKYVGSPWGFVRGKMGDFVGSVWKTIDYVRVLCFPTQRGTYQNYLDYKAGLITIERFSYPQFNYRRLVLGPLGYVSRMNMSNWIDPVWSRLATQQHLLMTGMNLFIQKASALFWNSMPNKDQEYNVTTNAPLLTSLVVSDGDLEPIAEILTAKYTTGTGALVVTFDKTCYGNGQATDEVQWLVMRKPLVNGAYQPILYSYGSIPALFGVPRDDATITIALPTGLTVGDLCVYLFCRDLADTIGYSPSKAFQVVAA